jgi:predicted TIM-barrel fold metal-dependent hydrolase
MNANKPQRIDVHHHLFPPAFIAKLVEQEHYLARGVALHWTPQLSIEDMDRAGVATAITSITAPGFAMAERDRLFTLNRECNEYGARMAQDYPGRFGLFASLPLPDVQRSLQEIEYSLEVLKADGIGLLTSYAGKWLGDPAFGAIMDELSRRKAVVYVHPTAPDCCRNLLHGVPDWVIEFPADTARTITSLLFSGTVARCPDIRFIFAHVGGILPLVSDHLVRAAQVDVALGAMVPNGVLKELRRFHYDTALRAHPAGLGAALQLVNVSQLLFGTDAPLRVSGSQAEGLLAYGFSDEELRKIEYENARSLLWRRFS